jgi:uncharacterized protein (DUF1330 family)
MASINPTREQFKQLMAHSYEGPIVMVNLLKFKEEGGVESYAQYERTSLKFVQEVGGRLIYRGDYLMPVIGDDDWDEVIIVEYPSIAAFIEMQRNKEYQAAVPFRTEALVDSRLYLTKSSK